MKLLRLLETRKECQTLLVWSHRLLEIRTECQKRKRSGVETKMERPGSLGLLEKVLHSGLERNIQAEIECGSRIWGKIDPGSIQGGVDEHSQTLERWVLFEKRWN